ncbi:hypothetical protein AC579_9035 [Pseudocercospora musae]|uniref:Plasmid pRiA4b Orf3-like domain-containing protein n=1 Tax=Pseudocercospora musae TaxID=113226 RepID=A0A139ISW0_9PEZI|nr:hypothetical protein AC579_9035 [Pseudocercospora musae]
MNVRGGHGTKKEDDGLTDDVLNSGEDQDEEDEEDDSENDDFDDCGPSLANLRDDMDDDSEASSDSDGSIDSRPSVRGYLLRVSMMTTSPPRISRILRVPAHLTFLQLHAVLPRAFDWASSHAWKFTVSTCTSATSNPKTVRELISDPPLWSLEESAGDYKLSDIFENPKTMQKGIMVEYLYDFGDM